MKNYERMLLDNQSIAFGAADYGKMKKFIKTFNDADHTKWLESYVNEYFFIGIENWPLFIKERCQNVVAERADGADGKFVIDTDDERVKALVAELTGEATQNLVYKHNNYEVKCMPLDPDEEMVQECISTNGVFLVLCLDGKRLQAVPCADMAIESLLKRVGLDCTTMKRTSTRGNRGALSLAEKVAWMNRAAQLYGQRTHVLVRGKVFFAGSENYVPLSMVEGLEKFEDVLSGTYEEMKFSNAMISHEYFVAEYRLHDELIEGAFKQLLVDAGIAVDEVVAGARFHTSDTSDSKMTARCFIECKLRNHPTMRISLPDAVEMWHLGKASIEQWGDALAGFGKCFTESVDAIEKLGNIEIPDVPKVVLAIREKYTWLPKKHTYAVAEEIIQSGKLAGTAIDVYIALNDVIQRQKDADGITPTAYVEAMAKMNTFLRLPYRKIADGEEWEKI